MAEHEAGAQGASMARHAVQLLRPLLRDGVPPGGGAPTWASSQALLEALASLAAVLSRQLPRLGAASAALDGSEVGIIYLQIDFAFKSLDFSQITGIFPQKQLGNFKIDWQWWQPHAAAHLMICLRSALIDIC